MRWRLGVKILAGLIALWGLGTAMAVWWLPNLLLHPPSPKRSTAQWQAGLEAIGPRDRWTTHVVQGPDGAELTLHWLHRPQPRGLLLFLHGFGDDALGTLGYACQLPEWDAAAFTFRGRDLHPEAICTLGAKERAEVVCAVRALQNQGVEDASVVLVGVSQGAGVALLALEDLEGQGHRLGGALLESPFQDLHDAALHHVQGTLGPWEPLARPAEGWALRRAGRMANFDPDRVSPLKAAAGRRTPVAFLTGDADPVTPLKGVQNIAFRAAVPLTVVPGAGHCEAGLKVPGGWGAWAHGHLRRWGLDENSLPSPSFPRARGENLQ